MAASSAATLRPPHAPVVETSGEPIVIRPRIAHPGPSLMGVGGAFVLLAVAGIFVTTGLANNEPLPSPYNAPASSLEWFQVNEQALRVGSVLTFASAVPLGIFAATVFSRLQFLGTRAAGATIALCGGLLATVALAAAGLGQWVLAQPGITEDAMIVRVFHLLTYALGGPAFTVPLGLLIAGVSISAGVRHLIPAWVMWFGILVAFVGLASVFHLYLPSLAIMLPIARFGGMAWLLALAGTLPDYRYATTASGSLKADDPVLV